MHLDALASLVDVHRPDERRPRLVGEQAGGAFGEHGRVEARVAVRRVERLAALMGLRVHRPARRDERSDVGDRVVDAVPGAAALDVERLVEVHRLGRVDGDERDRRLVRVGEPGRARCALRVCDDLGAKPTVTSS